MSGSNTLICINPNFSNVLSALEGNIPLISVLKLPSMFPQNFEFFIKFMHPSILSLFKHSSKYLQQVLSSLLT